MTAFWRLQRRYLWGSYGDFLVNARSDRIVWSTEPMRLSRTGPFVPPLCFTAADSIVLVSETTRQALERDRPFQVQFRRTAYVDVYRIPWHEWDVTAAEPPYKPAGGDPDLYPAEARSPSWLPSILQKYVGRQLVSAMEPTWELVLPVIPLAPKLSPRSGLPQVLRAQLSAHQYEGLFVSCDEWLDVIATEHAREWLQRNVGDWVTFQPIDV